jgi:hypothetical protein
LESRYRTTAAGGTALAAGLTDKLRLYGGEPDLIGPAVAADSDRVAAAIVGAINKQSTHAALAHFGKGDLLWTVSRRRLSRCRYVQETLHVSAIARRPCMQWKHLRLDRNKKVLSYSPFRGTRSFGR